MVPATLNNNPGEEVKNTLAPESNGSTECSHRTAIQLGHQSQYPFTVCG